LQAETEADAVEMTGDMLCDSVDKFVVRLRRVHQVEGSIIEYAFT